VIETLGGNCVGTVLEGQKRFALQARFGPEARDNLRAVRDLRVGVPQPDGPPLLYRNAWLF
jgi:cobalt-zinc-cadmium resistance protein CzcA